MMTIKSISYSISFLLLLFFGCNNQEKQNLGSNYYLMGDKENPASIKLVHGINNGFDDVVLGEIVDYDVDNINHFILIHRKITEKAKNIFEDHPLWNKELKGNDQYWIIETKYDGVNGPLTYNEYLAKRKELNISDWIKIRN